MTEPRSVAISPEILAWREQEALAGRGYFVSPRHALYVGWIMGIAAKYGLIMEPITDDDGNYTDRLSLPIGNNGPRITVVIPEPPEDWRL